MSVALGCTKMRTQSLSSILISLSHRAWTNVLKRSDIGKIELLSKCTHLRHTTNFKVLGSLLGGVVKNYHFIKRFVIDSKCSNPTFNVL